MQIQQFHDRDTSTVI